MQVKQTLLSILTLFATLPSLSLSAKAAPSEAAMQACQAQLDAVIPHRTTELTPGLALLDGSMITIQWQTDSGAEGLCRVTPLGEVLELTNPYALPQGQRPIENVLALQTDRYEVRILRLMERLYMNVYNKTTRRVELNRVLTATTETNGNTTYRNLLGRVKYEITISPESDYRLVVESGTQMLSDEPGTAIEAGEQATLY